MSLHCLYNLNTTVRKMFDYITVEFQYRMYSTPNTRWDTESLVFNIVMLLNNEIVQCSTSDNYQPKLYSCATSSFLILKYHLCDLHQKYSALWI